MMKLICSQGMGLQVVMLISSNEFHHFLAQLTLCLWVLAIPFKWCVIKLYSHLIKADINQYMILHSDN